MVSHAGEEIYACDIVGGEPTLEVLDTRSVDLIQMGSSNKYQLAFQDYNNQLL